MKCKFCTQKYNNQTVGQLKPLIASIQRLMNSEDETVADQCKSIMSLIGQQSSQVLESDDIGILIDHYIEEPDVQFMGTVII
jgi:hypothetical protein